MRISLRLFFAAIALCLPVYAQTVQPFTFPNVAPGASYGPFTLTVTPSSSYTWSISAGALPPNLSLSGGGVVSGTVSANAPLGVYTFTARATDLTSSFGERSFTITVASASAGLAITTTSLPVGIRDVVYPGATLASSGGSGTGYTYSVVDGALPAGLSLSSAGVISGTATATGNSLFTVRVVDSVGGTAARNLAILIVDFTCPIGFAVLGTDYSSSVGVSPFSSSGFALSSGSLPTGLFLGPSTGSIIGVPTSESIFTFSITATDFTSRTVTRSCSINAQSRVQLTSPRTTGRVGVAYSSAISAQGGPAPYSYSIIAGSLPPGLSLYAPAGGISGTPTTAGTSNFRVRVTAATQDTSVRDFSITVLDRVPAPTLRCPLPAGVADFRYQSALSLNQSGTLVFGRIGALPPGLTLDTETGWIAGTPTQAGSYAFTATVSGAASLSTACTITITNLPPANLNLACPDQEDLRVGEFYRSPAIASGGRFSFAYEVYQSSLPPGLSLDAASGLVSGTPTQAGTFSYGLRVVDGQNFSATTTSFCSASIVNLSPLSWITTTLPGGTPGTPYSATLQASGGVGTLTYILTGSLPTGLSLNSATGVISGTPREAGTASFSVSVYDANQQFLARSFTISVTSADPLRLLTSFVDGATVGLSYAQSFVAAGGSPPYRFTISSGALAPGLALGADGRLSGTATTAGTYNFSVQVSDLAGSSVEGRFALPVFQGAFRLGCPNSVAESGVLYQAQANVLGGSSPYLFSIVTGALPSGLLLDSKSGLISGRPTTLGTYPFVFAVSDASQNRTQTQCSIGVLNGALRVLTEGPLPARAGVSYTGKLEAAGGQGTYVWTLLVAPPESGFQLASDGTYTGTPTTKGNFALSVQVKDARGATATKVILLAVADSNLSLSCPALSNFPLGVASNGAFVIQGGLAPYTLTAVSGILPPSFRLDGITFTVKPVEIAKYSAQFRASDKTGTTVTTTCNFEVTGQPFLITTDSLPDGTVGVPYGGGIATTGGVGVLRFGITAGALPDGIGVDNFDVVGTPTRKGSFGFTVTATDELNRKATKAFRIVVQDGVLPLTILTGSPLPDAVVGKPYSLSYSAGGGKEPYAWTIDGAPSGIVSNGNTISGTPTQAGDVFFPVSVRDANGVSAQKSFLLRVRPADGLAITTDSLPDGVLGQSYSAGLAAEGGVAPYSWAILRGSLPDGVSFDPAVGAFTGVASTSGQYSVTVQVIDSVASTALKSFAFEVRPDGVNRLEITNGSLPNASLGIAYSVSLGARGGRAPYLWTIGGDLPVGMAFNSDGTISGLAVALGSRTFTVTVTDSLGLRATKSLSLQVVVDSAPGVTVDGLPASGGVNQSIPFTVRIASPFGVPVTGRLTLTFFPDAIHGADDTAVRFGNGTRIVDFTIPAGSTQVTVTGANSSITTGTLAGTIRVDTSLSFAGVTATVPARTILIPRAAPVITLVRITRATNSLEIRIEGYTSTRQLTEARIAFTAAGDVDLTTATQVTVNVQAAIQAWFASAASQSFGGQFALTLPFTVSGNSASITGVSVVIANGEGASAAVSAN